MSSNPNSQKGEWSSASEELFRAARSDHAPTSADRERVRRALAERIAAGPAASSGGDMAGHVGSALSRVLKVGFGVSLVVVATVATVATVAVKRVQEPQRVSQPAAATVARSQPAQPAVAANGETVVQAASNAESAAQERIADSAAQARRIASGRANPPLTTKDDEATTRAGRRAHARAALTPGGTSKLPPAAAPADDSAHGRPTTYAAQPAAPQADARADTGRAGLAYAVQPAAPQADARADTGRAGLAYAAQPADARADSGRAALAHAEQSQARVHEAQQQARAQSQADSEAAARAERARQQGRTDEPASAEPAAAREQVEASTTGPQTPQRTAAAREQSASVARASSPSKLDDDEQARAELTFVRKMQAALRAGEAEHVLELSREHAERWPHGTFVQEREGLRTIASCNMSPQSAQARAQAFLAKYPRTPLGSRVREACKLPLQAPTTPAAISRERTAADP